MEKKSHGGELARDTVSSNFPTLPLAGRGAGGGAKPGMGFQVTVGGGHYECLTIRNLISLDSGMPACCDALGVLLRE